MNRLLGALFPIARCVVCDADKPLEAGVCADCARWLPGFRLPPQPMGLEGSACAEAYAAYAYRGCVRSLILALKYQNEARPALHHLLPAMLELAGGIARRDMVVVPVPLCAERIRHRGYNQASLLAGAIAGRLRLPLREGWLWRSRFTATQTALDVHERRKNVQHAFRASAKDRSILLVDDILTSGATVSACADALIASGAREVIALAAAHAQMGDAL